MFGKRKKEKDINVINIEREELKNIVIEAITEGIENFGCRVDEESVYEIVKQYVSEAFEEAAEFVLSPTFLSYNRDYLFNGGYLDELFDKKAKDAVRDIFDHEYEKEDCCCCCNHCYDDEDEG